MPHPSVSSPSEGYRQPRHRGPVRRYCQTLALRDDPELIAAYRALHSSEGVWQETLSAIRDAGILEMEIYLSGNQLFMVVELPADLPWDEAMRRMAQAPRQAEWEALTARFQQASPDQKSEEKWQMMERIFHRYDADE